MPGFTPTEAALTLDARFPTTGATDYIAWSANGTSETSSLARTSVGATGWAAATTATPSVKANGVQLTSAAASAGVTVSHYSVYSASTGGTQRIEWTALDTPQVLTVGGKLVAAVGDLKVTLD